MSFFSFQDIMAAVTGVMILVTLLLALDPLTEMLVRREPRTQHAESADLRQALEEAQALERGLEAEVRRRREHPEITEQALEAARAEAASLTATVEERAIRLERVERTRLEAESDARLARQVESERTRRLEERTAALRDAIARSRIRFRPGERIELAPLFVEIRPEAVEPGEIDAQGRPVSLGALAAATPDAAVARLREQLRSRDPRAWQLVFVVHEGALDAFDGCREALHADGWEIGWQLWDGADGGFFAEPEIVP